MNFPARVVDTQTLTAAVKGTVVRPGDSTYDGVRAIWNAMIDRRPAVIVRCADAADVVAAIAFARERGLEISIRGGGHNIAGSSVCDGGVMIDLSQMTQVRVDAAARRAHVEPGALLADVDRATLEHGLATPLGINSTTGVAGLTLGGGFGWLTRMHGLTVDNLVSADVVGADGMMRQASAGENPDLFWALRGGGGNFGVVTRFEFALHPIPPQVLAGLLVFPMAHAGEVLRAVPDVRRARRRNRSTSGRCSARRRRCPSCPPRCTGRASWSWPSSPPATPARRRPRSIGCGSSVRCSASTSGRRPYAGWQQAFDPLLTPGARNYWKSHNFTELTDGAIAALTTAAGQLPSDQCEIFVALVSGAANRVPTEATAYAGRDTRLVINVHARWQEAGDDAACIAWARAFYAAAQPFASGGAYVNFMTADEAARVPSAYGANYARLVELKRRFDPDNVFHVNQNIAP